MNRSLTRYLVMTAKAAVFSWQPVTLYMCVLHTAFGNTQESCHTK
jgi:hypothetical protein